MSLATCGPGIRQASPASPDAGLGALGWLAVLIVAVLLAVLAHAASVRSDLRAHGESPGADAVEPAVAIAE